jgi:hypothetical protein
MAAELHFAKNALPLHLLLQHLKRLVDIVVADEDLHERLFRMQWLAASWKAGSPKARGKRTVGPRARYLK